MPQLCRARRRILKPSCSSLLFSAHRCRGMSQAARRDSHWIAAGQRSSTNPTISAQTNRAMRARVLRDHGSPENGWKNMANVDEKVAYRDTRRLKPYACEPPHPHCGRLLCKSESARRRRESYSPARCQTTTPRAHCLARRRSDVTAGVRPLREWTPDTFDYVVSGLDAWLPPHDLASATLTIALTPGWRRDKAARLVVSTPESRAHVPRWCGL